MATKVWQDVSEDWTAGANWSGGTVPVDNDTIVIGSGSQNITTFPGTPLTGVTFRVGPGYTGDIGTASTWLDLDGTFDFDGRGTSCYMTGSWTTVTVKGGVASDTMLNFRGNAATDIGTLRVLGGSGTVTVNNNATLDALEVLSAPGVTVTITSGVDTTGGGTITMDSGLVNWAPNATTVACRGGVLVVTNFATPESTATITTLELDGGTTVSGTCRHKSSGTISTLTVYGGFFDGRSNPNGAVTVTNASLYGGVIDVQSGLTNYTFSNGVDVQGDGVFRPSIGTTLTVT